MTQKIDYLRGVFGDLRQNAGQYRANQCPHGCTGKDFVTISMEEAKNHAWRCNKCGQTGNIYSIGYRDDNYNTDELFDNESDKLVNKYRSKYGHAHRLNSDVIDHFNIQVIEHIGQKSGARYKSLTIFDINENVCKHLMKNRWIGAKRKNYNNWFNAQNVFKPGNKRVYVLAGEWDVFAFWEKTKIDGVCWPWGEGPRNWQNEDLDPFSNKEVIIIYDNDTVGRAGSSVDANSLGASILRQVKAEFVKVVDLQRVHVSGGGDLDDFFQKGGSPEVLFDLVEKTKSLSVLDPLPVPERQTTPPFGDFGLLLDDARKLWNIGALLGSRRLTEIERLAENISRTNRDGDISREVTKLKITLDEMEAVCQGQLIESEIVENEIVLDSGSDPFEPMFYDKQEAIFRFLAVNEWAKLDQIASGIVQKTRNDGISINKRVDLQTSIKKEMLNRTKSLEDHKFNSTRSVFLADNGVWQLQDNGGIEKLCDAHEMSGKGHYLTGKFPYDFKYIGEDERAESKIIKAIEKSVPSETTMAILAKLAGITFFRHYTEHVIWLIGEGGDGKSVFLNTLRESMFNYTSAFTIEELVKKDFAKAGLKGKYLNISPEISTNQKPIESTLIKLLSGGDVMSANRKHRSYVDFVNTAKMWISGNDKPRFADNSRGINRRLIFIPFQEIPKAEQISHLFEDHIKDNEHEMCCFVSWVCDGYRDYLENGIQDDEETSKIRREVRQGYDSVFAFWMEMWEAGHATDDLLDSSYRIFDWYKGRLVVDHQVHFLTSFQQYVKRNKHGLQITNNTFTRDTVRAIREILNYAGFSDIQTKTSDNFYVKDDNSLNSMLYLFNFKSDLNAEGGGKAADIEPRQSRRMIEISGESVKAFIIQHGSKYMINAEEGEAQEIWE